MDAETTPAAAASAAPKRRQPPGVLLFVPAVLNRGAFIAWLKRIHAWTGFWGALAFLLVGVSGFALNHRSILKIDTGAPQEVLAVVMPVDPAAIKSADDLGKWAQKEFGTSLEPRAPRAGPGEGGGPPGGRGMGGGQAPNAPPNGAPSSRAAADGGGDAEFMGRRVRQAEVWKQSFTGPNGALTVEYSPGANTVKATKNAQNGLGVLKNLHKGVGLSMWWVLFIDTIAGALVAMSLTGALLWSRLHGPRLAALGIVVVSLGLALTAAWPSLL